jgi:hypothetical protein
VPNIFLRDDDRTTSQFCAQVCGFHAEESTLSALKVCGICDFVQLLLAF